MVWCHMFGDSLFLPFFIIIIFLFYSLFVRFIFIYFGNSFFEPFFGELLLFWIFPFPSFFFFFNFSHSLLLDPK